MAQVKFVPPDLSKAHVGITSRDLAEGKKCVGPSGQDEVEKKKAEVQADEIRRKQVEAEEKARLEAADHNQNRRDQIGLLIPYVPNKR